MNTIKILTIIISRSTITKKKIMDDKTKQKMFTNLTKFSI